MKYLVSSPDRYVVGVKHDCPANTKVFFFIFSPSVSLNKKKSLIFLSCWVFSYLLNRNCCCAVTENLEYLFFKIWYSSFIYSFVHSYYVPHFFFLHWLSYTSWSKFYLKFQYLPQFSAPSCRGSSFCLQSPWMERKEEVGSPGKKKRSCFGSCKAVQTLPPIFHVSLSQDTLTTLSSS